MSPLCSHGLPGPGPQGYADMNFSFSLLDERTPSSLDAIKENTSPIKAFIEQMGFSC